MSDETDLLRRIELLQLDLESFAKSRPCRRLTDQERDELLKRHPEIAAILEDRKGRNFELRDFMRDLLTRQGTKMPDFDALYRRKAELDIDHHP